MNHLIQSIYDHSPVLFQSLGITMYGLQIRLREYGKKFRTQLEDAESTQWLGQTEIRELQSEKLRELIAHCYQNVPYYRNVMDQRGLTPKDIEYSDDLLKLPVLTRDEIVHNFTALQATNVGKRDRIVGSTSGTTGIKLELLYDRRICRMKTVVDWRHKRWGKLDIGDPFASFLGHFVKPSHSKGAPYSRMNWALNNRLFSVFHMDSINLADYVIELKKFRPVAVEGYPSTLFIMAKYILSQGLTVPVRAAFTSSETLYDYQREAIEKAFECRVFDYFGMAERVVYATECEKHEGLHLNEDFGITEFIKEDGKRAEAGEIGRIVATSLHNYTMPLIRYETSDISALQTFSCSCGRGFPLLERVTTKAEDIVTTRAGKYISPSVLNYPFDPMDKIVEAQYLQEDIDNLIIKVVKRADFKHPGDTQKILNEMKVRVGPEMNVTVEFVDQIERTAAGKFRCVVSKVPLKF